ncbi:alkaline phosphatase [Pseudokordiimonas caeni]|uniref:alkaline phosphatase n=1 Tax=Pseudokordiimonas caeni TaxID=2997908 RepID=UPI002811914E|nr:alkaline phosphatase [Pseudokordiimonas caeni]
MPKSRNWLAGVALLAMSSAAVAADSPKGDGTAEEWFKAGADAIAERAAAPVNKGRAKNVILFVGDGMGISTITAGRILEGQMRGEPGEENKLSFEKFPYTALVKTYNVDAQVPDSAGTASALNTGIKTRIGAINTLPGQEVGVCKGSLDGAPKTLAMYAEEAGLSTGIVTTTRLSHATPAAVYAHAAERDWEADANLPDEAKANGCPDIAVQMVGDLGGDGLEVALGGGRRNYVPEAKGGKRLDGRDLTAEWVKDRADARYVTSLEELKSVDPKKTKHLLGFFNDSDMNFEADRTTEPSLADMTEAAIRQLSTNKKGYYLMVEGARIDHAHHGGNAYRALHDVVALSAAVKRASELVDLKDTLILVTADHSHVFTMAGYPSRGNPIFGLAQFHGEPDLDEEGRPYTTLGYQNGPGAVNGDRPVLTQEQVLDPNFRQQSLVHTRSETHGGEDVALFATGPRAYLASGTMEQNAVFHLMRHALDLKVKR